MRYNRGCNGLWCTRIPAGFFDGDSSSIWRYHPARSSGCPLTDGIRGSEKGGLRSRSPCKMPGLPNRPFLENRGKRLDSIRGISFVRSADGARYEVFKIWVSFRPGTGQKGKRGGPEIKSRQIAIRGCTGHYMRPNLWPFWRLGGDARPDCRR